MITKGIIKKGEYFDSVSLMLVAKEINKLPGVADSAVVMGTAENRAILQASGLLLSEFDSSSDTDLLIAIKAENGDAVNLALEQITKQFEKIRSKSDSGDVFVPKSLKGAVEKMQGANLALISVAGKYAAHEARKALLEGLHVLMFSDNVSVADELELKQLALEKDLLMMGPDCGTAIINGVPLAFANVVPAGNIGMVAASGTGLQEVSCVIANQGAGISQAIGTGGRDVKKEIGGLMFFKAFKALESDANTKVIVAISKPPHTEVTNKLADLIKQCKKPVVTCLIGGDASILKSAGAYTASTLEEAGVLAAFLSSGKAVNDIANYFSTRKTELRQMAVKLAKKATGKYLRGLYSGGTLCDETQLILKDTLGYMYGNSPLNNDFMLTDVMKSKENTIVDMGDDAFTVGRPHPMIDFSLRNKRMLDEAADAETAVILLDVVLGYGSNLNPADELCPVILKIKNEHPSKLIVCSITGTSGDPQNKAKVSTALESAGAVLMPSNAAAAELAGLIIEELNR